MLSKMSFEQAMKHILHWEGGYVNDPKDPGGETKYGISRKSFPNLDIKNLTEDQAKQLYRKNYWTPLKCAELPPGIDILMFNFGVNVGVVKAGRLLQAAINYKYAANLTVDGIIGPATLKLLKNIDEQTLSNFCYLLLFQMAEYYNNINQPRYLSGWLNRLFYFKDLIMNS